jgi:hypothetical protein
MMNCNARPSDRRGPAHRLTRLTNICCIIHKHITRSWRRGRWRIKLCVIIGRSGRTGLRPSRLMRYTALLLYPDLPSNSSDCRIHWPRLSQAPPGRALSLVSTLTRSKPNRTHGSYASTSSSSTISCGGANRPLIAHTTSPVGTISPRVFVAWRLDSRDGRKSSLRCSKRLWLRRRTSMTGLRTKSWVVTASSRICWAALR